jgi:signal transduction histidine kinase
MPPARAARKRALIQAGSREEFEAQFPSLRPLVERGLPPVFLAVPMTIGDRLLGVLAMAFSKPRRFTAEDCGWATALAQDCAMAFARTQLFEAERGARVEADAANRAKDEFLGTISRALRAPLTSVLGGARLLRPFRHGDPYRKGVELIARGVDAERRLVGRLIDLSRMAAHELRMDKKPIDLAYLVSSCAAELRQNAANRGVELAVGPRARARVVGDAIQLRRVICELVGNAIAFTPQGGHVAVELEANESRAVVRVRDDGRGIPPDEIAHVFEPFGRRGAPVERESLRIGLSIAKYVAEEHRGAVHVESPGPGRGTTTTLELPWSGEG